MSLLLVICGTISNELGGVGDTVEVCGEVASVKLGSDWPKLEYGTWTLSVFGVGDLLISERLMDLVLIRTLTIFFFHHREVKLISPHVHGSVIVPGAGLAAFFRRQRARRSRLFVRVHADVSTLVVTR